MFLRDYMHMRASEPREIRERNRELYQEYKTFMRNFSKSMEDYQRDANIRFNYFKSLSPEERDIESFKQQSEIYNHKRNLKNYKKMLRKSGASRKERKAALERIDQNWRDTTNDNEIKRYKEHLDKNNINYSFQ